MPIARAPKRISPRLLAAVVFALVSSVACAQADDIQEAGKLLRSGQHAPALERVNKALASKPRDPQARFLKGLILTEQGNTKEAIEIFQRLTVDFPGLPEPYNNLAVIFAAQGQYDKARAALEQSIRTHPSYATAYENLGDVYAKLASQAYDKAFQIDSSNAATQQKLSLVRDLVGGSRPAGTSPTQVASGPSTQASGSSAKAAAPASSSAPPPAGPAAPPVAPKSAPAAAGTAPPSAAPAAPPAAASKAGAPEPKPAPGASDPSREVLAAVRAWADAWSRKDADRYLAFYAKDFRTPQGEPREAWEKGRRDRIAAPKSIEVAVVEPKVTVSGGSQASVTFRQEYRSDARKVNSRKTLVLSRTGERWLIQQEQVAN